MRKIEQRDFTEIIGLNESWYKNISCEIQFLRASEHSRPIPLKIVISSAIAHLIELKRAAGYCRRNEFQGAIHFQPPEELLAEGCVYQYSGRTLVLASVKAQNAIRPVCLEKKLAAQVVPAGLCREMSAHGHCYKIFSST